MWGRATTLTGLMRHTYVILSHRAPRQLERLVDRLRAPGVDFLLHVDRRSDRSVHARVAALSTLADVAALPARRTPWPGFGHLAITLEALRIIAARPTAPDYVSLLTGQDYPLKPPERIASRLTATDGASFLQHFPLPRRPGGEHAGVVDVTGWPQGGLDRVRTWNFELAGRELRLPGSWLRLPLRRRVPHGIRLYGGSGYWTLSRRAVDEIQRVVERRPELVRFFRRVYLPHEMFFQTILAEAPAAGPLINDDLRYIDWSVGGSHPKILNLDDLPFLTASDALFARKFDGDAGQETLDRIDRELLGRA